LLNFLYLKTEFLLLIGLPQQLNKLNSSTIHLPNGVTFITDRLLSHRSLLVLFLASLANLKPPWQSHINGGGTAFLICEPEPASLLSAPTQTFKSFEMSAITLNSSVHLTVFNVYRPPPATTKTRKPVPFSDFLTDLYTFLSLAATTSHDFLITGD